MPVSATPASGNAVSPATSSSPTDSPLNGSSPKAPPLAPGLYLVATPIGNLQDITLRALDVLRQADIVACEDTRQTQKLLNHFGIETRKVSYHQHNEQGRADELVEQLRQGARVAVVSDAGTPGISDPGGTLVAAAIAAGVAVYPVPGANAALAALVASGLDSAQFCFLGFMPARGGERRTFLESLAAERRTMVFYESPHRIAESLADVEACLGSARRIVLARELTKLHEEFLRGTVAEVRANIAQRQNLRGEMVLLLAGASGEEESSAAASLVARVQHLMREERLDEKDALKLAAKERGIGKSEAYREWQRRKR